MRHRILPVLIFATLLAACGKKAENTPAPAPAASPPATTNAPAQQPPAAAGAQSEEQAKRQAALDYATMEDAYINDPKGQWAVSAKATSSFGDANKEPPESQASSTPWQATGAPNNNGWNNNSQDIGFDSLELTYDKPVKATEVRMVGLDNESTESINKIELIDTEGKTHLLWSGLSDAKQDARGSRTWFVRKTEPGDFQAKAVKLTFANNVASGYKEVDAVQLIGE